MPRFTQIAALALLSTSMVACSSFHHDEQQTGTLTRHLSLIGEDGKRYGSVDMDPIGGGKVYDSTGALIATLTPVAASSAGYTVPAQAPVTTYPTEPR